ncbi:Kinesin light chain [Seminavis robusta]|uniref:Kinesin light chain n=1 Tax=Seminavis robusta TaxID=568900 RepID=A0A9N8H3B2_9STRA|nr:Kinesin light chain [Seminavis robusta]|eukprot:Sro23_g015790.1 Kinesin light chain (758) ;mRNA; r:73634-75907
MRQQELSGESSLGTSEANATTSEAEATTETIDQNMDQLVASLADSTESTGRLLMPPEPPGEDEDEVENDYDSTQRVSLSSLLWEDQPSWIAGLIDQDPFMHPTLFPYHIPTGFSMAQESRRYSGSTIATTTTDNVSEDNIINSNEKKRHIQEAMESLRIHEFLKSLQISLLRRPRPTFRVSLKAVKRKTLIGRRREEGSNHGNNNLQLEIDQIDQKLRDLQRKQKQGADDLAFMRRLVTQMYDQARELDDAKQVQKALEYYQSIKGTGRDVHWEARAYRQLGKSQITNDDPKGAASSFQKALQIWKGLEHEEEGADAVEATARNIADTFYLLGTAELTGYEALMAAKSLNLRSMERSSHFKDNSELMKVGKDHLADAMGYLQQALDIFKHYVSRRRVIDTTRAIGRIYCIQNQFDLANQFLEENMSFLREKLGASVGSQTGHEFVADVLLEMGDTLCQKSDEARAIVCYKDSLYVGRQHLGDGHTVVDEALVALGDLYSYYGRQSDLAMEYFQQVVVGDYNRFFDRHVTLKVAILLFQDNQPLAALAEFQDVLQMCRNADAADNSICFTCLLSSAVCYYSNGDKQEAKKCYKEAIHILSETVLFGRNNTPKVEALLRESEAQLYMSKLGKAFDSLNRRVQRVQSGFTNAKTEAFPISNQSEHHRVTWFYYLQNDSSGNPDGWYVFPTDAGKTVEKRYQVSVFEEDPVFWRFTVKNRGGPSYEINLKAMTQTNTSSQKTRPIHRSVSGEAPSSVPTEA